MTRQIPTPERMRIREPPLNASYWSPPQPIAFDTLRDISATSMVALSSSKKMVSNTNNLN
jgi:hypothetical protein